MEEPYKEGLQANQKRSVLTEEEALDVEDPDVEERDAEEQDVEEPDAKPVEGGWGSNQRRDQSRDAPPNEEDRDIEEGSPKN